MSFVNPQFFFVMLIPLIIFAYMILTDKDVFLDIFDEKVLKRLSVSNDALPKKGRNLLLLISLFFMIVAMARPVVDHGDKIIQLEGLSAVVALDISASMRAKDLYPNRLSFAKQKMLTIFDLMPHDELSLIAFAHASFIMAPFSSDKTILQQIVEGVSTEHINMGSTDFKVMGEFVSRLLKEKKEKILIVLSDGGEREELEDFASIMKQEKIALYTILVGTKEGAPVLDSKGKPLNHQGKMAITQRNDRLGEIATEQGGSYIIAKTGDGDIEHLVQMIKSKHQSNKKSEIVIHNREEYFYYPLSLGVLFLLLGMVSLPRKGAFSFSIHKKS